MARALSLAACCLLLGLAAAQTPSGKTPERHPKLDTFRCSKHGGCHRQRNAVVLDSATHPVYQKDNPSLGCGNWGEGPNATVCPDEATCAKNCLMDGISDYAAYGVKTNGASLTLDLFGPDGTTKSPRVYLLSEDEHHYEMFHLTGNEFSFDVDMSKLPCGMNGALYLSEMAADGGKSRLNKGGAYYGTGYCDAQCYATPFINGVGNIDAKGACCSELDIWEANSMATMLTPHPCRDPGLYECSGDECAFNGVCDKYGCGYSTYRLGNKNYYGPHLTVDTTRPFTAVTQFTADSHGVLTQYHRLYVQDGKIIHNAAVNVTGPPKIDYINDEFCEATGATRYMDLGAAKAMGQAMSRGMVLAMSIWWDEGGFMTWLDSGDSGPCSATEGDPANIVKVQPHPEVVFSNIKFGEIGSTFSHKK